MTHARLEFIDAGNHRSVAIEKAIFRIGRLPSNDLRLTDRSISREHAEIARDGADFVLRNTKSTSGLYVNGRRTAECRLAHGDRIELGRMSLVFLIEGHERLSTVDVFDQEIDRFWGALIDAFRAVARVEVEGDQLMLVVSSARRDRETQVSLTLDRPTREIRFAGGTLALDAVGRQVVASYRGDRLPIDGIVRVVIGNMEG